MSGIPLIKLPLTALMSLYSFRSLFSAVPDMAGLDPVRRVLVNGVRRRSEAAGGGYERLIQSKRSAVRKF